MHYEFYPEMDEFAHHDIDEGITKTFLPFIKSVQEIYSRIHPTSKCLRH